MQTYEKNSRQKLTITFVMILVIAGAVVMADHLKSKPTSTVTAVSQNNASATTATSTTTASSAPATTDTTAASTSGTYTASSNYYVPHGTESISVSLTVSNGVVTAASIQNSQSDRDSARYQEDFAAAYKSYVVGKKVSGLQLSIIAGASDTTEGFNDALTQIANKVQA